MEALLGGACALAKRQCHGARVFEKGPQPSFV